MLTINHNITNYENSVLFRYKLVLITFCKYKSQANVFNASTSTIPDLSTYFSSIKSPISDKFNNIYYSYFFSPIKFTKKLVKFIAYLHVYFWLKITFRGKGFRVRKFAKSRKMTFNFGRSH